MKAKSTFSLKDELFNPENVDYLAALFEEAYPDFARRKFHRQVVAKFPDLELKERIVHITECLEAHLPKTFPKAVGTILKALPEKLDPTKTDDDFGDFIFAPLSHFVVRNGCSKTHLNRSLKAIREITMRFSAEDAIRYFINDFPDETIEFLQDCSVDKNYHVRRLASEGTRPKLPWSQKLVTDYQQPAAILDQLHSDPTRYVTRSVANHLNDISKLDPDWVISILKDWKKQKRQNPDELAFITRHSLRTLVKDSNPKALQLLGFTTNPDLTIESLKAEKSKVALGDALEFGFALTSNKKQNLLIDYLMEFPSGRSKVFKLKQVEAVKGEQFEFAKRHPMRLMTTRAQALGAHRIILQINGQQLDALTFELTAA